MMIYDVVTQPREREPYLVYTWVNKPHMHVCPAVIFDRHNGDDGELYRLYGIAGPLINHFFYANAGDCAPSLLAILQHVKTHRLVPMLLLNSTLKYF